MNDRAIHCADMPDEVADDLERYLRLALSADMPESLALVEQNAPANAPSTIAIRRPIALHTLASDIFDAAREPSAIIVGDWQFNEAGRILTHPLHASIELTDKETELLSALLKHAPSAIGRNDLLQEVWGYDDAIDTRTLETHIYRLRQKLEQTELGACLMTTEGGYGWHIAAAS